MQEREDKSTATRGIQWLTPENTQIFEATFSLLHCAVKGETQYLGVFAVPMFPVSHHEHFISLRYTDWDDKVHEIGVIRDLKIFPCEAQRLIRANLSKHCHEQKIKRVLGVREEHGLLFFQIETEYGPEHFVTPWRSDRAEEYGENGKLLLDAYDNRYVIPDIGALPPADQHRLTRYIYW